MLKAPVGGAIGTLIGSWRETDDDASDASEIEDARKLIQPLIPTIHDRAVKRVFQSRMMDLVSMPRRLHVALQGADGR